MDYVTYHSSKVAVSLKGAEASRAFAVVSVGLEDRAGCTLALSSDDATHWSGCEAFFREGRRVLN
jgi:hypothetical protein